MTYFYPWNFYFLNFEEKHYHRNITHFIFLDFLYFVPIPPCSRYHFYHSSLTELKWLQHLNGHKLIWFFRISDMCYDSQTERYLKCGVCLLFTADRSVCHLGSSGCLRPTLTLQVPQWDSSDTSCTWYWYTEASNLRAAQCTAVRSLVSWWSLNPG